ncbi:hypothetical protein [Ruegeria halocynthiae]|uniref:hypothetical protein n=1 Tax=Ruegeria halocynthiae TaxID=985054 RepID=UPI00055E140F|nr:hypothetical protein [Ruegeria halocynthiae]
MAALSSESPYAAQLLSVSGALFVSGPAQQQIDQNIDFLNGYEDYQKTRCGGSDGACAEAYTEAFLTPDFTSRLR